VSQQPPGFAFFETALGLCGVAWNERGLIGVLLPEADAEAARRRLIRRHPDAREAEPPAAVRDAIARIVTLLADGEADLSPVALDMTGVAGLRAAVYAIARTIPPGSTLTYGEIAARLGQPNAAREVGQALGRNPWPIVVPCHRVLGANGKLVGFSAPGGVDTKLKMLAIERARTSDAPALFDDLPLSIKPR
jgi:methylated-DNA-[protein]-cysteine S-methyltransferase